MGTITLVTAVDANNNRQDLTLAGIVIPGSETDQGAAQMNLATLSAGENQAKNWERVVPVDALTNTDLNVQDSFAIAAASTVVNTTGFAQIGGTQTNLSALGVMVFINVTAVTGAGTMNVTFQVSDPVSAVFQSYGAQSGLINATGLWTLTCFPATMDAVVGANNESLIVQRPLPRIWRLNVTAKGGTSLTMSVTGNYLSSR